MLLTWREDHKIRYPRQRYLGSGDLMTILFHGNHCWHVCNWCNRSGIREDANLGSYIQKLFSDALAFLETLFEIQKVDFKILPPMSDIASNYLEQCQGEREGGRQRQMKSSGRSSASIKTNFGLILSKRL